MSLENFQKNDKIVCTIPVAHEDNFNFNYTLNIPSNTNFSKNALCWIITAIVNKKMHIKPDHVIQYLKYFIYKYNNTQYYYQELNLPNIEPHESTVLRIESKRLRDKIKEGKTTQDKHKIYDAVVGDIQTRKELLIGASKINENIYDTYLETLKNVDTRKYIIAGIRKVLVNILGKLDPLDAGKKLNPPTQHMLNVTKIADFPEFSIFKDMDLTNSKDNKLFYKKMKEKMYGNNDLQRNLNKNNNIQNEDNLNNSNNLNNNDLINNNNNNVFPVISEIDESVSDEEKEIEEFMDMNNSDEINDPVQQFNKSMQIYDKNTPTIAKNGLDWQEKRKLWYLVKEKTNNIFSNYLQLTTNDWLSIARTIRVPWDELSTEKMFIEFMLDNWDYLRKEGEPPLKRVRFKDNNITYQPQNQSNPTQIINPPTNYSQTQHFTTQIPYAMNRRRHQQHLINPKPTIPTLPTRQQQTRQQWYSHASAQFNQQNNQIPTTQLHTWQQQLLPKGITQRTYKPNNNLLGGIFNQNNTTQTNHPYNNINTGYGDISQIREPFINHFKNSGLIDDKLKRLNTLLNSKNKQDEFILTILSSKLHNFSIFSFSCAKRVFGYI